MSLGPMVLLVYGILMLLGGFMGYRAGSSASLIAGSTSGVLLLVAWLITWSQMALGLWIGVVIAGLLSATFAIRLVKTKKVMPAGGLMAISLLALVLLVISVR